MICLKFVVSTILSNEKGEHKVENMWKSAQNTSERTILHIWHASLNTLDISEWRYVFFIMKTFNRKYIKHLYIITMHYVYFMYLWSVIWSEGRGYKCYEKYCERI
jgi:hypothetical protein